MESPIDPPPPPPPVPPRAPEYRLAPRPAVPLGGYGYGVDGGAAMPQSPPTAAPLLPTPQSPVPVSYTARLVSAQRPARIGAVVGIVGALVVTLGSFVPWVDVDVRGRGLATGSGWTNVVGDLGWGPILLVLALVVAIGLAPAVGGLAARWAAAVAAVGSAVSVSVAAYQLVDLGRDRDGLTVSIQVGPYLVLAGSLLAIVGSLVAWYNERPAKVTAPRAVGAVG